MIKLTPTQRLEWLREQPDLANGRTTITNLLDQYERFLETTSAEEKDLVSRFMDKDTSRKYLSDASKFGDLVFEALTRIGDGNQFHRVLVVERPLAGGRPQARDPQFYPLRG